ncbi:carbohydrate ABC transporter permease [Bacillus solitudinis]|uniref:carbohydrate ABC transporter permease n=1 Tax=Bacillus solitudinis TaxID=2014074 RepID=UPI0018E1E674|nr:carbohydrate ABC transporter permease [Bacillus solitudinis]
MISSDENGKGKLLRNVLIKCLIGFIVFISVAPIIWLLMNSIKAPDEFTLRPVFALPESFHFDNYVRAWYQGNMNVYFKNSIIATFTALFLIIVLGIPAAFAIEKMKWKLKHVVLMSFLAGIMVPIQMVLLPLFLTYHKLNLLNTLPGLIIIYIVIGLPLTIFLFANFFKSVPNELFESAVIDGANIYQVLFRVALPLITNAIVTVALVQFFFIWNDLILAQTFISDNNLRTIQVGLLRFVGTYGQREWGPTFASISMAVIPTLLIYIFLNKSVIKGLTSGAVKG